MKLPWVGFLFSYKAISFAPNATVSALRIPCALCQAEMDNFVDVMSQTYIYVWVCFVGEARVEKRHWKWRFQWTAALADRVCSLTMRVWHSPDRVLREMLNSAPIGKYEKDENIVGH